MFSNLLINKISLVLLIGCVATILAGCAQSGKEQSVATEATDPQKSSSLDARYNDYLLLMNEKQRANFFQLKSDAERDRFLQLEGLEQIKHLDKVLNKGISPKKAQEILGDPISQEEDLTEKGKETRWIYSRFNGYRNVKYAVVFANEKLIRWEVWLN